jgi:MOSC domain-containing protein YiiM
MTGTGTVEGVFVTPESGGELDERDEVEALAGQGLRGDRYFREAADGTALDRDPDDGFDLTLIEREAVEAAEREGDLSLTPGEHRRNVETRGVALNHLVGERFRVGDVVCRGVELCEPCAYLQELTHEGVLQSLVHRGGLCAEIVESGVIRPGDTVEVLA